MNNHINYLLAVYPAVAYLFFAMQRALLKSKIHRATVTGADLNYEGSVTIDRDLLEAADILEFEQVQIYDVTNGARITTYAIPGEPGEGAIQINGAAAHLVRTGDIVIIASYAQYAEAEAARHQPRLIRVDGRNRQVASETSVPRRPERSLIR